MLFTIPPSKIKDFCHLPLHKGGFRLRINKQTDKLEFIFLYYYKIYIIMVKMLQKAEDKL